MLYWARLVMCGSQVLLGKIKLFTACRQDPTWVNIDPAWCNTNKSVQNHFQLFSFQLFSWAFPHFFKMCICNLSFLPAALPFSLFFLFPSFQQWPKSLRYSALYSANSVWTLSELHLSSWSVSNTVFHFTPKKITWHSRCWTFAFVFWIWGRNHAITIFLTLAHLCYTLVLLGSSIWGRDLCNLTLMPAWLTALWSGGLAQWRVTGCLPHWLTIAYIHPTGPQALQSRQQPLSANQNRFHFLTRWMLRLWVDSSQVLLCWH